MTLFNEFVQHILEVEGGYVNHPSDKGGPTNFGITVKVARKFGYIGPMQDLPRQQAIRIYKAMYWDSLKLDEIERISPAVVKEMFDTGVNQGVKKAGEYLQRSLNAFNRRQRDYFDLKVDGVVGKKTVEALRKYVVKRGPMSDTVLLRALNSLQGARYIEICEKREKNEDFAFGWFKHRVVI